MKLPEIICLLYSVAIGAAVADPGIRLFETDVEPILKRHCYECHSHESGKAKGGLVLDSREGWAKGGGSGPAILPGEVDGSLLIDAVRFGNEDLQMPPKRKLPAAEIAILERWVKSGAPDPRRSRAPQADPEKLWALQPIRRVAAPAIATRDWPLDVSDNFLLEVSAKSTAIGPREFFETNRLSLGYRRERGRKC